MSERDLLRLIQRLEERISALERSAENKTVRLAIGGAGGSAKAVGFLKEVQFAITTGIDGDPATPPSYRYNMFDVDGNQIGDGDFSPQAGRSIGSFAPATMGLSYVNRNGDDLLLIAFETEATRPACQSGT